MNYITDSEMTRVGLHPQKKKKKTCISLQKHLYIGSLLTAYLGIFLI